MTFLNILKFALKVRQFRLVLLMTSTVCALAALILYVMLVILPWKGFINIFFCILGLLVAGVYGYLLKINWDYVKQALLENLEESS